MSTSSTLVLARKHRPRYFAEMVGQEHVVRALANALTQQRLHHAYLFTGTRGVGKTTVSRILAMALNCTGADGAGGITAEPCGVCGACRDIDAGRCVDYGELDGASNRGIDEARELIERSAYKPVVGRFKVYMIDEVHMLTREAFNALLKLLEEPPEYLKFVLATTDVQKVLPTVLSRCLQFNLRSMAPALVQKHLASVLAEEAIPADAGALRLLARAARGSMRDALSLADQAIAFGAGALREDAVRQMLGAVDRSHAVRIVQALAAGDAAALVDAADGLRALGLSAAGALEEVAMLLQQMAVAQAVPGALDADDPDAASAAALAGALPADELQVAYSLALHGRAELALAPDDHAGLVMVLLRMLAFRPAGATQRPEPARRVAAPPPPPPVVAPAVAAPPAVGAGDRWAGLVAAMNGAGSITALARELAMQAECVLADEAATPARFGLRVERDSLRAATQIDKLQTALAAVLGREVHVVVESGPAADTPAQRHAAEQARRQAEAEQIIRDDPLVRTLLAQYSSARIVPGSVKPY